jgi:hypothetical protein
LCSNILQYWLSLLYTSFKFVTRLFLLLSFSNILLFLLLLSVITFIHGIYNYIIITSHVAEVQNVADIQWLQCTVLVVLFYVINVLYFYISTLRNVCAVSNVAVVCNVLMSCCRGMLSKSTLLLGLYILKSFRFLSSPHICLLNVYYSKNENWKNNQRLLDI